MAEDEADDAQTLGEEEEEEDTQAAGEPIKGGEAAHQEKRKRKTGKCNPRIDELARPRKWALLALWREYADSFDAVRKEALRQRIQEDFCMSPEETERYVAMQKKPGDGRKQRSERLKELRKEKAMGREEAYCQFKKFLKKAMMYACTHVAPPLVSPMLRYMSESILVLLSEIHCVEAPKRCDKTNIGQFLLALSDWSAIFLAHIYYEVDRDENEEIDKLKQMEKVAQEEEDEEEEDKEKAKPASETEGDSSAYPEESEKEGDETDEGLYEEMGEDI